MLAPYKREVTPSKLHQCDCCEDNIHPGKPSRPSSECHLLTFYTTTPERVRLCWECYGCYIDWHEHNIALFDGVGELIDAIASDVASSRHRAGAEAKGEALQEERKLAKHGDY